MNDENLPPTNRLRDEYKRSTADEHLHDIVEQTSRLLRERVNVDLEGEEVLEALFDSPLFKEVTKIRAQLLQAEQENMTDALTGIPNRAGFIKTLHDHILTLHEEPENSGSRTAVAFIDLDGFKQVNDQCGHDCGDDALIRVAERFQKQFEPLEGVVGRIGGDEMVIFLPSHVDEVPDIETEIRKGVDEALDGLVYWKGATPYPVGASIGVHVFDHEALHEAGETLRDQISSVLKRADERMYEDKWGDCDPVTDANSPEAPKNRRLMDLRAQCIRQKAQPFRGPGCSL